MKLASASLNQTPLDWDNNKENILAAIASAKNKDIDLLCLPEMCIPGYGCEDMFLHPWVAEKSFSILKEILPYTAEIATILGLPLRHNNLIYNVVCLIEDGKILGFQAKQNLPVDGLHYESRWFSPWESEKIETIEIDNIKYPFGDQTYTIKEKKVGFEICEDAWVKDRPACKLLNNNVDIILNPSASHFALLKSYKREQKVITASSEFNCTYIFANQLGNESGRVIYDGDAVIGHKGELASNTPLFSYKSFELSWCEINYDQDKVVDSNISTPIVSKEEQFVAATTLALYDYLRKSRSRGFVLSLSGGADSAICLVLIIEMIKRASKELGCEKFLKSIGFKQNSNLKTIDQITKTLVTTAYQSTNFSSTNTFESAKYLAQSVSATFHTWTIDNSVDNAHKIIEKIIGRKLNWELDDILLQNIQARSRSPLIWMLANHENKLLVTTSNRSEGSVGYATMDGDTSGSIAPIAGVDKPFIIHWLKWAEKKLNYPELQRVNSLVPTAELRPQENEQTDEQDLMPYKILNQIEQLFALQKLSPLTIHSELTKTIPEALAAGYVIKFFELWSRNQWKRERTAPSLHISEYNIDPRSWFRFPILSGGFRNELDELKKLIR